MIRVYSNFDRIVLNLRPVEQHVWQEPYRVPVLAYQLYWVDVILHLRAARFADGSVQLYITYSTE